MSEKVMYKALYRADLEECKTFFEANPGLLNNRLDSNDGPLAYVLRLIYQEPDDKKKYAELAKLLIRLGSNPRGIKYRLKNSVISGDVELTKLVRVEVGDMEYTMSHMIRMDQNQMLDEWLGEEWYKCGNIENHVWTAIWSDSMEVLIDLVTRNILHPDMTMTDGLNRKYTLMEAAIYHDSPKCGEFLTEYGSRLPVTRRRLQLVARRNREATEALEHRYRYGWH